MRGTWQTTDSGSSGIGTAAAVIFAAIVVAAIVGPVVAATVELLRVVLIVAVVIIGLAVIGGAGVVAWRLRHRHASNIRAYPTEAQIRKILADFETRPAVPGRPVRALPAPAPERPAEIHLHLHGVTAEEIAAIVARDRLPGDPH